jgi:hypothetical protein
MADRLGSEGVCLSFEKLERKKRMEEEAYAVRRVGCSRGKDARIFVYQKNSVLETLQN